MHDMVLDNVKRSVQRQWRSLVALGFGSFSQVFFAMLMFVVPALVIALAAGTLCPFATGFVTVFFAFSQEKTS
jgi:hypothetical protein